MKEHLQTSQVAHPSLAAKISAFSGVLSMLSVFLALWVAFLVHQAGILTFIPPGREYFYPLFWLLWLLLPIGTIICGFYARKTATEQADQRLALIGLILGCLSFVFIVAVTSAEIALFLQSLGCTASSPCS